MAPNRFQLNQLREKLKAGTFEQFVVWHLQFQGKTVAQINRDMAQFVGSPSRFKLLLAAREWGKSMMGVYYPAYRLLREPNTRVHFVSHSDGKAMSLAEYLLDFMRDSPIMHPFAPTKGACKSNYMINFAKPDRDRSVSCSGVTGSRTGMHVDLIICDDVESPNNANTTDMREKLLKPMGEMIKILHDPLRVVKSNLKNITNEQWERVKEKIKDWPENTQLIYLGTYQTTESVYILPKNIEDGHPLALCDIKKFPALDGNGKSTFPEKFSDDELAIKKTMDTKQNWMLHYMLDPTHIDTSTSPIMYNTIVQLDIKPRDGSLVCWIDPTSGSKRKFQYDEFSALFGCIEGAGRMYVQDLIGWKNEDSFKSYGKVVKECVARGCYRIMIEAQDPTQAQVLRRVIGDMSAEAQRRGDADIRIQVEEFTVGNARKETRVVEALEVSLNNGQLVLNPRVLLDPKTREQLKGMRYGILPEPNDRVDIMASFVIKNSPKLHANYKFQALSLTG